MKVTHNAVASLSSVVCFIATAAAPSGFFTWLFAVLTMMSLITIKGKDHEL